MARKLAVDRSRRMVANPLTGRLEPPQRPQSAKRPKRPKKPHPHLQTTAVKPVWWFSIAQKQKFLPPILPKDQIQGRHKGELIFILGNGPSLLLADRYRKELDRFTRIGTNLSYLFMQAEYHMFVDKLLWDFCSDELLTLESTIFYPTYPNPKSPNRLQYFTQFRGKRSKPFSSKLSSDWRKGLYIRGVSIAATNLAYIFGAKQIALLGIDLNDKRHFYTGREKLYRNQQITKYTPKWLKHHSGKKYPLSIRRHEDWAYIAKQFEKLGVKVWNCSPKSALTAFEKIELKQLLANNPKNRKIVHVDWDRKIRSWALKARKLREKHYKKPKTYIRSTSTVRLATKDIHGRHKGELIIIYGNGPSLRLAEPHKAQLSQVRSIGVNVSYLLLPSDYLVFSDHYMWKHLKHELLRLKSIVFCQYDQNIPYFNQWEKYLPAHSCIKDRETLCPNWKVGIFKGISSAIAAVNLAYLFGASQIALLGIDLNSPTHFYTGDKRFAKNALLRAKRRWWGKYMHKSEYPNTKRRLVHWQRVTDCLEKHGIKLWNCSPDSRLQCAEKIPLGELLKNYENYELKEVALPPERSTIGRGNVRSERIKPWDREDRG